MENQSDNISKESISKESISETQPENININETQNKKSVLNLLPNASKMDAIRAYAEIKCRYDKKIREESLSKDEIFQIENEVEMARNECISILSNADVCDYNDENEYCCGDEGCCGYNDYCGDEGCCENNCCEDNECYGNKCYENNCCECDCRDENNCCEDEGCCENNCCNQDECNNKIECCEDDGNKCCNQHECNNKIECCENDGNKCCNQHECCGENKCCDENMLYEKSDCNDKIEIVECCPKKDIETDLKSSENNFVVVQDDVEEKGRYFCGFRWFCF